MPAPLQGPPPPSCSPPAPFSPQRGSFHTDPRGTAAGTAVGGVGRGRGRGWWSLCGVAGSMGPLGALVGGGGLVEGLWPGETRQGGKREIRGVFRRISAYVRRVSESGHWWCWGWQWWKSAFEPFLITSLLLLGSRSQTFFPKRRKKTFHLHI